MAIRLSLLSPISLAAGSANALHQYLKEWSGSSDEQLLVLAADGQSYTTFDFWPEQTEYNIYIYLSDGVATVVDRQISFSA